MHSVRPVPTPEEFSPNRRAVLGGFAAGVGLIAFGGRAPARTTFDISLAQWSFHRRLRGQQDDPLEVLDFPAEARRLGIGAVEYVNSFLKNKARDREFLSELKKRCSDVGVRSLLIMCDGEGRLGDPDASKRSAAVENHRKWVAAARSLGCHSIRVNASSDGAFEEQQKLAADGLRQLTEIAADQGLSVLVENHGGLSSNGQWLAGVMKRVDHPGCGTLPDFGNFRVAEGDWYDRYRGVAELMPFARAVSAKSHDFDDRGQEVHTDYLRMLKVVLYSGYRGSVGIEYEGRELGETEGVLATKRLLESVRDKLAD